MRAMAHGLFGNRLLVVDDDPSVGRLVKRVGESVGFKVIATEDPAVFATTAQHWQPTVIIMDLNMPGTMASSCCAGSLRTNVQLMSS